MEIYQFVDLMFRYLTGIVLGLGGIGIFLLCSIWFIAGATLVFAADNTNKTLVVLVLAFIMPLLLTTIFCILIINQVIDQVI